MEPTDALDTAETRVSPESPAQPAFRPKSTADRLSETADRLPDDSRVGQYIIDAAHSRGGFATIYRATHERLGRPVALKVLHSVLADTPNIVKRFEQEARAVNRIRHPNIVDITDYGELDDGRPYFAMEWLEGPTLKSLVAERGALSQDDALRICEDILPALSAAHELGIIHRDLKLSNVIGVPKGDWFHFKLLDFGIAKVITGDRLTEGLMTTVAGNRVGSPMSMAPEQIRCQPVDARTDIYALGVLLFEVVTGKPPYRGKTAVEVEKRHLRAPVPDAFEFAPVSAAVSAVIARCMQKSADDRYASANALLADMRKAVADDSPPLDPVPTKIPQQPQPQAGARSWLYLSGLGVLALLVIIVAAMRCGASGSDATDGDKPTSPAAAVGDKPPADASVATVKPHDGTITRVVGEFDAKAFDVTGGLALARKIARKQYADAKLILIEADNVGANGTADLTLGKNALVMYKFRSPKHSAGDAASACLYHVYADRKRYYHYPVPGRTCDAPLLGAPKCTAAHVWKKARKHGLPKKLPHAQLRYTSSGMPNDHTAVWVVTSGTKAEVRIADDCKK